LRTAQNCSVLFWLTVGAPTTIPAQEQGLGSAAAFIGAFYVLLIGSKLALAWVAGRSRKLLAGKPYRYVMKTLGLLLCLFSLKLLLYDGLVFLGWW
jgi:threonine/homoserine/homoserine lactone efflux protein